MVRFWTVYDHPTDFPDHFVARQWEIGPGVIRPTDSIIQSGNLEVIRTMMLTEFGLTRMERDATDDPKIIEVWV